MAARITQTGPEGAALLARLHAEGFSARRAWDGAAFEALLTSPFTRALLANEEDRPAGFVVFRTAADEGEILTLAVAPSHRRRGIGAALVFSALEAMEKSGARRVFLEVAADNAPAIALYEGCGFSRAGSRKAYYERPDGGRQDALILVRAP